MLQSQKKGGDRINVCRNNGQNFSYLMKTKSIDQETPQIPSIRIKKTL